VKESQPSVVIDSMQISGNEIRPVVPPIIESNNRVIEIASQFTVIDSSNSIEQVPSIVPDNILGGSSSIDKLKNGNPDWEPICIFMMRIQERG
jgi:hypothetical protein